MQRLVDRPAAGPAAGTNPAFNSQTFLREWRMWAAGAIVAYLLANLLIAGWPHLFIPDLSHPYFNEGDGLFNAALIQRVMEGWVYSNPRVGYPFDSSLLDYPNSDTLNFVLLRFYGFITGNFFGSMNLFIIFGFPLSFISAYWTGRHFGVRDILAVMMAFLFAFMPFPFTRFNHILLLSYFTVPIFFYFGNQIVHMSAPTRAATSRAGHLLPYGIGVLSASFGLYNAAFGMILLATAALFSVLMNRSLAGARYAALLILSIGIGISLNVAPNVVHRMEVGANTMVAARSPVESEIFGLKLIQMLYPRYHHRVPALASVTEHYEEGRPLVNENHSAALGMIGSLGFLALGAVIVAALARRPVDPRLSFLSLAVLVLFLFGTIGGLGAIFADQISPLVRAWNRISVFISFGALSGFTLLLQAGLEWWLAGPQLRQVAWAVAGALTVIGIADQTPAVCVPCNTEARAKFEEERAFVQAIEQVAPAGSPIYQLPFMSFPEARPRHKLLDYAQASGFVNSRTLRWSYGGMMGRAGDLFYQSLAEQPVERQLTVLRRLGFAGIYLDRRGYPDGGNDIIGQLTQLLKSGPLLTRDDGAILFFRLDAPAVDLTGLSPGQIMERAGYRVDTRGRYMADLSEGLSFSQSIWPSYIKDIQGLSLVESWGRWSNADTTPTVRILFSDPLPAEFTLVLSAQAFGPNADAPTLVRIGEHSYPVTIRPAAAEYRIAVSLGAEKSTIIEIVPPKPISPNELGINNDPRHLGIGLIQLRIETKP
ncbi:DUF7024 domain-containing protein [Nitrospirillum viridazoti]|uniref:Phosphoglycerol transferase n=1 Tax=Nitrospirillum amazonense TaxID=28077 RepID=A0A560HJ81_9PROT|nr:hypothetical protein [Nitrospirillum amazonense]TWB46548.1 phosphoglycerol transferase [Nitrospirillum amazonense]